MTASTHTRGAVYTHICLRGIPSTFTLDVAIQLHASYILLKSTWQLVDANGKDMKKLIIAIIATLLTVTAHAQKDVTQFLGIPVDGTKSEMIRNLKAKGFRTDPSNPDALIGEFNGTKVNVYVCTNGDKVYRIALCDVNTVDESQIKIKFNKLCRQFENNPKYATSETLVNDFIIPDDENILWEITINKKDYSALFYQKPVDLDMSPERINALVYAKYKYTPEQFAELPDFMKKEIIESLYKSQFDIMFKKSVWFKICEHSGEYYICMYYDNEYNQANGEDL